MTREERVTATEDSLEELTARHENAAFKQRNVLLSSFQDNRNTLDDVSAEVCRTGRLTHLLTVWTA